MSERSLRVGGVQRVTGARAEIAEGRPPMIALSFRWGDKWAGGEAAYGLDAMTAFELAHATALMAMKLDPSITKELRRRMAELDGAL
jgi:hypothetical protein